MQCECGHLHASVFSDVIIRNPEDFSECAIGEKGIIQAISTIPESYPGHSLLTEDEGVILGEDDCPCGRKGKYFKIFGRLKNAEIRGCSDTYAADYDKSQILSTTDNNQIFNKITYLVGNADILKRMETVPAKEPFDKCVIDFLNDLSRELVKNPKAKIFPDVISFGFWIRISSINDLKQRFEFKDKNVHVGRGMAFHIAPSNVPVNYAYSLVSGLLCGNANVVRVPSKDFAQIAIINNAIKKVLEIHPDMKPYICLIRYERDYDINNLLSNMCDTRIIWGGDVTIEELRKSKLPARATEITFADRYSLALIDSDSYMMSGDKDKIAIDFYNDTYLTDQNACTSPKVVVWTGTQKEEAKEMFWNKLYSVVEKKYLLQPIMGVDKLSQSLLAATADDNFGEVKLITHESNRLVRVSVTKISAALMKYRGNSGYFYEYDCDDILELVDFCNNTHCQTIGIIGNKEMLIPLLKSGIKGVDRVVRVGHTMEFDLNWDGYNLVDRLTRTVVI